MSSYSVGSGHDVALVDLDLLVPQPHSEGIKPARRTHSLDGSIHEEAWYIELIWDTVGWNAIRYRSILSQFGLTNSYISPVTIYVPGIDYQYTRFNGTAIRPEVGEDVRRQRIFMRDIVVLVRDLEESA